MSLPNVLCIGLAKSGTTALWYYFSQHPEVFVSSLKETNYFVHDCISKGNTIDSLEKYKQLFEGVRNEPVVSELSPSYITHYQTAASRIKETLGPDCKLILLLRNPVERVYSRYMGHFVRDKATTESFAEVQERIRSVEIISPAIRHFQEVFGEQQLGIFLSEDLNRDTDATLARIWQFIGVSNVKVEKEVRINKSGKLRSRALHNLMLPGKKRGPLKALYKMLPDSVKSRTLNRVKNWNMKKKEPMDQQVRKELEVYFRKEVEALSELTGQDLKSRWFKTS